MIELIVVTLTSLIVIIFGGIGLLGAWDDNWFQIGPNDTLHFFKIEINTTFKYIALMAILMILFAMQTIGNHYIESWLLARRINFKYNAIEKNKNDMYEICNTYRCKCSWNVIKILWKTYKAFMTLIQIHIAITQFDIWLLGLIVIILTEMGLQSLISKDTFEGFTEAELIQLKSIVSPNLKKWLQ